ncbi:MAG TPA: hypothetical protein VGW77_01300 [Candidatus Binatia bacterium]|jgi:hypothetical protein|nr:hypothetical protein [Candidatus Binatia bacterium]
MASHQGQRDTPWWEAQLPVIRSELAAYLARRVPAWRADHDDILNDSLLAVTQQIRLHPLDFPKSWFCFEQPANEEEKSRLRKLSTVILQRRIADVFRKRASLLKLHGQINDEANFHQPTAERRLLLARMLEITLLVLSRIPAEDRDLVALVAGPQAPRKVLDENERQRLHRLRRKLRDEIARQLGADSYDILLKSG